MNRLAASILLTLLMAAPAAAGTAARTLPEEAPGGIVLDRTVSAAGQAFYRQFCALWHDQPLGEQLTVAVRERASARHGALVLVEYAGAIVFQAPLPARADLGAASRQAVELAYEAAVNAQVKRLLFGDDELAPDEF